MTRDYFITKEVSMSVKQELVNLSPKPRILSKPTEQWKMILLANTVLSPSSHVPQLETMFQLKQIFLLFNSS